MVDILIDERGKLQVGDSIQFLAPAELSSEISWRSDWNWLCLQAVDLDTFLDKKISVHIYNNADYITHLYGFTNLAHEI